MRGLRPHLDRMGQLPANFRVPPEVYQCSETTGKTRPCKGRGGINHFSHLGKNFFKPVFCGLLIISFARLSLFNFC